MSDFDFNPFEKDVKDPADLGGLLNDALLEWSEILDSVRALANAERLKLIEQGWDAPNAELMAMSVYGSFLSQVLGLGTGSTA